MRSGLVAFSVLLALLVAACGGGGDKDGGSGGNGGNASPGSVKLYHDKAPWENFFKQMGTAAQAEAQLKFEQVPYSDTTSYQQVIQSSFQTREVPDVFTWWSGYRLAKLVKAGIVADVSATWQEAASKGDVPEGIKSAFTVDGKQYALPLHISYWGVFYNKRVFAKAGIKQPPTTWAELLADAEKIKKIGAKPFFATVDGRWPSFIWFEEMLVRSDPDLYGNLCAGKVKYTDPKVVEAMKTWKSLIDGGNFTALDTPIGPAIGSAFAKDKFAMLPIGTWFNGTLVGAGMKPGKDYGIFVLPNINPSLTQQPVIFETGPLVVPKRAPNVERSQQFLSWWNSESAQKKWSGLLGDAPTNPKVSVADPNLTQIAETAKNPQTRLMERYWECTPQEIVEAAVDGLAKFMVKPDSYMQVLEDIQKVADQTWPDYNK